MKSRAVPRKDRTEAGSGQRSGKSACSAAATLAVRS